MVINTVPITYASAFESPHSFNIFQVHTLLYCIWNVFTANVTRFLNNGYFLIFYVSILNVIVTVLAPIYCFTDMKIIRFVEQSLELHIYQVEVTFFNKFGSLEILAIVCIPVQNTNETKNCNACCRRYVTSSATTLPSNQRKTC